MTNLPVLRDSLEFYLAEVSRFPVLSRKDEHELAVDYFENKNLESAHKLVTSNLRFVIKVAMEYQGYGLSVKDLVQEGNLGLMNAVKKFNPYKGFKLITYAVWWIRACIQDYILKSKGAVKRAGKAFKKQLFYRSADPMGTDDTKALPAQVECGVTDLSLDTAIGDGDDGKTHLDMLVDSRAGQEEMVEERQHAEAVGGELAHALTLLNDNERMVVEKRIMSDAPLSLQAIGDKLGVSRERVRQIEKATLEKLRNNLSPALALG